MFQPVGSDHGKSGSWAAYAAATWALIFAAFHVAWACGRYVGLEPQRARTAFARPAFLAYDLAVAGICVLAVPVALALGMPWGRRLPQRPLALLAWAGTALLLLRSTTSIVQVLYLVARGRFAAAPAMLWELWFYLGALLFGIATWRYWHNRPTPHPAGSACRRGSSP
jgi:hypothetical protein